MGGENARVLFLRDICAVAFSAANRPQYPIDFVGI
jgi:hypothetical protein